MKTTHPADVMPSAGLQPSNRKILSKNDTHDLGLSSVNATLMASFSQKLNHARQQFNGTGSRHDKPYASNPANPSAQNHVTVERSSGKSATRNESASRPTPSDEEAISVRSVSHHPEAENTVESPGEEKEGLSSQPSIEGAIRIDLPEGQSGLILPALPWTTPTEAHDSHGSPDLSGLGSDSPIAAGLVAFSATEQGVEPGGGALPGNTLAQQPVETQAQVKGSGLLADGALGHQGQGLMNNPAMATQVETVKGANTNILPEAPIPLTNDALNLQDGIQSSNPLPVKGLPDNAQASPSHLAGLPFTVGSAASPALSVLPGVVPAINPVIADMKAFQGKAPLSGVPGEATNDPEADALLASRDEGAFLAAGAERDGASPVASPSGLSWVDALGTQGDKVASSTAGTVARPAAFSDSAPPPPAAQVANQVMQQLQTGRREVSFQLNPETLGQVRVQLSSTGPQQVASRLVVETPEALRQLQQDMHQLKQTLARQGITLEHVTVMMAGADVSASGNQTGSQAQQHRAFDTPSDNSQGMTQFNQSQQQAFQQQQQANLFAFLQSGGEKRFNQPSGATHSGSGETVTSVSGQDLADTSATNEWGQHSVLA